MRSPGPPWKPKTILQIPFTNFGCCHTGGSLAFDLDGNLYVAEGNTTDNGIGEQDDPKSNYVNQADAHGHDQRGSANTNSLLGKILRIRPLPIADAGEAPAPGAGTTYKIPAGNLYPVGQYPAGKTRPEIYTMGHRNPYSIQVDPYRNWLAWGDIGPDEGLQSEEHNLVTKQGFMGWPYFAGANLKYRGTVGIAASAMDPDKPLNKSKNNTGLEELPPAQPAIRPFRQSAAITGPIHYYDGRHTAAYRLPPHFNKKWLFTDFNAGYIRVATPSEDGKSISEETELFSGGFLSRPLDLEIGHDGALYTLDYDGWFSAGSKTSINRVEYTGTCADRNLVPPPTTAVREAARMNALGRGGMLALKPGQESLILPPGIRQVVLYDLNGERVFVHGREGSAIGNAAVEVPARLRGSVLVARFAE